MERVETGMRTAVVFTDIAESQAAGRSLGEQIATAFAGMPPDAVVVFASPRYAYADLLAELKSACRPSVLVGCSSAGEFTADVHGESGATALALSSPQMRFNAALATGVSTNPAGAARDMAAAFRGLHDHEYRYRVALILTDALAGHTDEFLEQLALQTAGTYRFVGGGAGDNAQFRATPVLFDTRPVADAAVGLEILSHRPIGIGVRHGWQPASASMRVTESEGLRLVSLNAMPAVEAFEEHARATGQHFDPADPIPYFLHNVLGVSTPAGYKLRVPLAVNTDGSVSCAAEVPPGATVHFMRATVTSAADAAASAAQDAIEQLEGGVPQVALFFDCVATRLRLGQDFGLELDALTRTLGGAQLAGCNTHGQVARAEGEFSGFHNCTAVVCVLPR
jgi:hypothetical protein